LSGRHGQGGSRRNILYCRAVPLCSWDEAVVKKDGNEFNACMSASVGRPAALTTGLRKTYAPAHYAREAWLLSLSVRQIAYREVLL
jgi:hypothetical protein